MTDKEYEKRKKYHAIIDLLNCGNVDAIYQLLDEFYKVSVFALKDTVCAKCGGKIMRNDWGEQLRTERKSKHGAVYCSERCHLGRDIKHTDSEYVRILKKNGGYNRYMRWQEVEKHGFTRIMMPS